MATRHVSLQCCSYAEGKGMSRWRVVVFGELPSLVNVLAVLTTISYLHSLPFISASPFGLTVWVLSCTGSVVEAWRDVWKPWSQSNSLYSSFSGQIQCFEGLLTKRSRPCVPIDSWRLWSCKYSHSKARREKHSGGYHLPFLFSLSSTKDKCEELVDNLSMTFSSFLPRPIITMVNSMFYLRHNVSHVWERMRERERERQMKTRRRETCVCAVLIFLFFFFNQALAFSGLLPRPSDDVPMGGLDEVGKAYVWILIT